MEGKKEARNERREEGGDNGGRDERKQERWKNEREQSGKTWVNHKRYENEQILFQAILFGVKEHEQE